MIGWFIAIAITITAIIGIIIMARLPRRMWVLPSAAGALAMAGYAYQGQPDLPASPAQPIVASSDVADQLIDIRQEMDSDFGAAKRYLITSDSAARKGNYDLAAAFIKNGLNTYPNDAELWGALGVQLMLASNGQISPPAQLAFDRARKSRPKGPVPDYFEGLRALFDGNLPAAEKAWTNALNNATPKAKYRPLLERQLSGLQQLKQQGAAPNPS